MGYDARQTDCSFFIAKEDKAKAFEVVEEFSDQDAESLKDVLDERGWEVYLNKNKDIVKISYCLENWHAEDIELMQELAPFVKAGSFIQFSCNGGEDIFRLVFDGKECKKVFAKIVWE